MNSRHRETHASNVLGHVAHEILACPEEPLAARVARAHAHLEALGSHRYDCHLAELGEFDPLTDPRDLEADVAEELADAWVYGVRFHGLKHPTDDRLLLHLREQLGEQLGAAWVTLARLRARRRVLRSFPERAQVDP